MSPAGEERAREFYVGVLGLREIPMAVQSRAGGVSGLASKSWTRRAHRATLVSYRSSGTGGSDVDRVAPLAPTTPARELARILAAAHRHHSRWGHPRCLASDASTGRPWKYFRELRRWSVQPDRIGGHEDHLAGVGVADLHRPAGSRSPAAALVSLDSLAAPAAGGHARNSPARTRVGEKLTP